MLVWMRMIVFVGVWFAALRGRNARGGSRDGCPTSVWCVMVVFQMNVELNAFNAGSALAGNMEMILAKTQPGQLVLELMKINTQINERAEKHVAADAAENIQ